MTAPDGENFAYTTPDRLQQLLNSQEDLQINSYGNSPAGLLPENPEAAIEFIRWNVLALTDELHELLAETGWKPWATSRHVNLTAARGELVDAFHFFMNLALVLNMDGTELFEQYQAKRAKNAKRQEDGYDGVTGKCPGCKRAMDDDATACYPVKNHRLGNAYYEGVICVHHGRFYKTGPAKEAPTYDH
ncbi:deoxyuridine triphosphatase [Microbacterium phage Coltrane]|uniref:Deoxyuridine triphosphatase n=4 Tax=Armstrongvirus armstrong TaxID=2734217 RepID=A0A3G2KD58_9CAUD|nr:dUTPase [Microbacterium phage Armstrong]AYN55899.2 deoxyuridine triphosphatase [Microbacterium phage Brahms]AYN57005.1 deoxyuridine triphosphatase [Microbacterium phage Bernstein]AYN57364.2 deoxyuridine triphosphatase [Microbacterium phage Coltrane]AYN58952.1 deoxyuridine triphosphatase [Microbacterium phage Rollins]QED11451.1 deoxyuridine triphosphatase [Microbacterium phage Vitas]UGL61995.1 deoxyuridine triphosphatase [Microbacterium phage Skylord]UOK18182.1 deoxyuridine triphosphatase 